jgi:hypothetical protein
MEPSQSLIRYEDTMSALKSMLNPAECSQYTDSPRGAMEITAD